MRRASQLRWRLHGGEDEVVARKDRSCAARSCTGARPAGRRAVERLRSFGRMEATPRGRGMPARFEVTDEALDAERHVVAVSGEVDLYTASDLKAVLAHAVDEGCTSMVIDLTNTNFMDSTGLSTLVSAQKRMRSRGGKLVIVNVDPSLAYTFQITGLDLVFKVVDDRRRAIAELEVV